MIIIYFLIWERRAKEKSMSRGRNRGRGRSRLPVEQRAWCGAQSQDPEIMAWTEVRHPTDWAPQGPLMSLFKKLLRWFQCAAKVKNHWLRRCPGTFQHSSVPPVGCMHIRITWGACTAHQCHGPLQPKSIRASEYQGPGVTFNTLQVILIQRHDWDSHLIYRKINFRIL